MIAASETPGIQIGRVYIVRVLLGLAFTLLPIVTFVVIFLFTIPISLKNVAVILALLIPWFSAMAFTAVFLSRRYEACVQRVLSGEYWVLWQYESDGTAHPTNAQDNVNQVYLGPLGVCWAAENPILIDFGDELTDVCLLEKDEKPFALQFTYRAKRRSPVRCSIRSAFDFVVSFANLGSTGAGYKVSVPIPSGHEAEAEDLVERFRLKLQGLPFDSWVDRWLGLTVYFVSAILYGVLVIIIIFPPAPR